MPIAFSLYTGQDLNSGTNQISNLLDIKAQCFVVNLRPGFE